MSLTCAVRRYIAESVALAGGIGAHCAVGNRIICRAFASASALPLPAEAEDDESSSFVMPSTDQIERTTPFWEVKMNRRFKNMDMDQDGYITKADFEAQKELLRTSKRYSETTMRSLIALHEAAWQPVWAFGISKSAMRVGRPEFMRGAASCMRDAAARAKMCQTLEHLFSTFFTTFDKCVHGGEARGFLTEDEFIDYVYCWNLTEEDARTLFADIDRAKTGKVTREQYLLAAWDFYFEMTNQKGPGLNFLGILRRKSISLVM